MFSKKVAWEIFYTFSIGQVDSRESPEMPEIMQKTENFIKVTKYLAKLKENINKLCYIKKSHLKKH